MLNTGIQAELVRRVRYAGISPSSEGGRAWVRGGTVRTGSRRGRAVAIWLLYSCAAVAPVSKLTAEEPSQATVQHADARRTSGAPASSGRDPGLQTDRNPRYKLCLGDTLELTFPITPEFNQTIAVQPDGFISLAGTGDILVLDKTVDEVRSLVRNAYSSTLHDPVVSIIVKDFVKPYFIAGGALGKPGRYELRERISVTEAIEVAGGFTESSKHSQVLLFRRKAGEWAEVRELDVKQMFSSADLEEDMYLRSGDMIFVPQNTISKVKKWIPIPSISVIPPF